MSHERRTLVETPATFPPGWTIEHVASRGYDSPDQMLVAKHSSYATCYVGTGRHATAANMEALCREAWLRHPQIRVIFLDVDEVLADWIGPALRLLGHEPAQVYAHWDTLHPRPWDVFDVVPRPALVDNVTDIIDRAGATFWADLPVYPWAAELFDVCQSYAPTILLTSPSRHASSHAGKFTWMQRVFGQGFRDYLMGSVKYRVAHPGALLIDDSPHNCDKFVEHGGHAILFPGVGNDLHHVAPAERVRYVAEQLKGYRT